MPEIPLSKLPLKKWGTVTSLTADGTSRYRLLDLGLVPGTAVGAVRRSPAGDPTAFCIRGAIIALRKEEAEKVTVVLE